MKRSRVGPPGSAETERDRSPTGFPGGALPLAENRALGLAVALENPCRGVDPCADRHRHRPRLSVRRLRTEAAARRAGRRHFVGSAVCAVATRARRSSGRLAPPARDGSRDDKSVLGDFNDATFEHYGVKSRFFRRDGKFFVETDGPDGKLAEFEIKYTFGVSPLQQYLIEFPDGRLQALSIAWDSRPKDKGGQRWFHLYPNEEIPHDDILHWTKLNQNWNFMCAECHSTGVRKNYDAAKDTFATTWAEISVGCETCHGQGSAHVAWARSA